MYGAFLVEIIAMLHVEAGSYCAGKEGRTEERKKIPAFEIGWLCFAVYSAHFIFLLFLARSVLFKVSVIEAPHIKRLVALSHFTLPMIGFRNLMKNKLPTWKRWNILWTISEMWPLSFKRIKINVILDLRRKMSPLLYTRHVVKLHEKGKAWLNYV